MREQTIAAPIEFSGIGLHTGQSVTMRILPATAGTGIVFRRTELDASLDPDEARSYDVGTTNNKWPREAGTSGAVTPGGQS